MNPTDQSIYDFIVNRHVRHFLMYSFHFIREETKLQNIIHKSLNPKKCFIHLIAEKCREHREVPHRLRYQHSNSSSSICSQCKLNGPAFSSNFYRYFNSPDDTYDTHHIVFFFSRYSGHAFCVFFRFPVSSGPFDFFIKFNVVREENRSYF